MILDLVNKCGWQQIKFAKINSGSTPTIRCRLPHKGKWDTLKETGIDDFQNSAGTSHFDIRKGVRSANREAPVSRNRDSESPAGDSHARTEARFVMLKVKVGED
jgi:hypothetical protein